MLPSSRARCFGLSKRGGCCSLGKGWVAALTYGVGVLFIVVFLALSIYDAVNKDFEINGGLWLGPLTVVLGGMFGGAVGIQIIKKRTEDNGK
jgi:hypothetical protein